MKIKSIIATAIILLIATMSFAQRGNRQWGNDNVQTISGTVTDNSRPCGFIKADDGKIYKIHLGPIWYWNQNDYALVLTTATIKGNIKEANGEYDVFPYTITQNGKAMTFTDDNGVPKWSQGKGNGKGKCWGRGNGNGWGRGNGKGNNPNCPYRNK
ncbi:MAG: hypothetical protein NTU73_08975 [Ignavibacteriae bacterium]|nr:hypothetical protein [Ignavibacteriota bacterium]